MFFLCFLKDIYLNALGDIKTDKKTDIYKYRIILLETVFPSKKNIVYMYIIYIYI